MDISFPKFKLEQKYKMKKLLHALGIKNLFTRTADLGHLTDQTYVAVSQVSFLKLFAISIVIVYKGPSQETVSYTLTGTLIAKDLLCQVHGICTP